MHAFRQVQFPLVAVVERDDCLLAGCMRTAGFRPGKTSRLGRESLVADPLLCCEGNFMKRM